MLVDMLVQRIDGIPLSTLSEGRTRHTVANGSLAWNQIIDGRAHALFGIVDGRRIQSWDRDSVHNRRRVGLPTSATAKGLNLEWEHRWTHCWDGMLPTYAAYTGGMLGSTATVLRSRQKLRVHPACVSLRAQPMPNAHSQLRRHQHVQLYTRRHQRHVHVHVHVTRAPVQCQEAHQT